MLSQFPQMTNLKGPYPAQFGVILRMTPLCYAAEKGDPAMTELLLAHGADVNGGNNLNGGPTPLCQVLSFNCDNESSANLSRRKDVIRQLLAHRADANRGNEMNRPPLLIHMEYFR